MAKVKFGMMPCEGQNCESHARQQKVVVFRNEKETLSYSCDWCGRAPYARLGTGQHTEWMETVLPFDVSKPLPEAVAAADALPPAPAARPNPARKSAGLLID
jgi:hypothetical protein